VTERTAELQSYAGRLLQSEHRRNLALAAAKWALGTGISLMATACGDEGSMSYWVIRDFQGDARRIKALLEAEIGNGCSNMGHGAKKWSYL